MKDFTYNLWNITLDLAPWLLFGCLIAGLLHVFMPAGFIRKHLGKGGLWSIVKAVAIGVPMPLCSCGVIPAAIGLKKDGASDGPSVGFLISTPQTGIDSIFVSAGFLGWPFAIFKVLSAFITGLIGGLIVDFFEKGKNNTDHPQPASCCSTKPEPEISSCCSTEKTQPATSSCCCSAPKPEPAKSSCCSSTPKETETSSCCSEKDDSTRESKPAIKEIFSFATKLLSDIHRWLIVGIILAAIISTALPENKLSEFSWTAGITGMLLMLMISLPMYICATSSVPLAASLVAAGMPAGSALVLLMAGPATNIATIGAIAGAFGKKVTIIYVATVAIMSVLLGMGFESVISSASELHSHGHTLPHSVSVVAAVILICLLISFFIRDMKK